MFPSGLGKIFSLIRIVKKMMRMFLKVASVGKHPDTIGYL